MREALWAGEGTPGRLAAGNVPLVEVAFGVRFVAPEFDVVNFGEYYQLIRDDFATRKMVAPIATQESTDLVTQTVQVPTLPRVWFEQGTRLIQLQSDRFVYNWRKDATTEEPYPGFAELFAEFRERWAQFRDFAARTFQLPLHIEELSLTYVNQIRSADGMEPPIFNFRAEPLTDDLPKPEHWVSQLRFALVEENAQLTISARPAIYLVTQERMTQLDVVVGSRDAPPAEDTEQFYFWFDAAHSLVHRGFKGLVRKEWRAKWGFAE